MSRAEPICQCLWSSSQRHCAAKCSASRCIRGRPSSSRARSTSSARRPRSPGPPAPPRRARGWHSAGRRHTWARSRRRAPAASLRRPTLTTARCPAPRVCEAVRPARRPNRRARPRSARARRQPAPLHAAGCSARTPPLVRQDCVRTPAAAGRRPRRRLADAAEGGWPWHLPRWRPRSRRRRRQRLARPWSPAARLQPRHQRSSPTSAGTARCWAPEPGARLRTRRRCAHASSGTGARR
mmetsp:Transcript_1212/g.3970  ORF Transcript_1212/g.3970 Transcript_1212/m.3970 type:complete len:239 (+) Transcript_1212:1575-2291(+)